jgi:hypothetical protein
MDGFINMLISSVETPYPRDVRSPDVVQVGRANSMKGLRVFTLLVLDIGLLCLAGISSAILTTPWEASWRLPENLMSSLLPLLSLDIIVLIAGSFYQSGEARRNYAGVAKALTLSAVLFVLFLYFYYPDQPIARAQFLSTDYGGVGTRVIQSF